MRLILTTCFLFLAIGITFSQNIKYEPKDLYYYRYPLKPLDKSLKTYSYMLEDLGDDLAPWQRDSLQRALHIPGYKRVRENGDVKVELIVSALSITNKEVNDKPIDVEKNGNKSVMHQYWYDITYSFPMKIRVVAKGQVITEQDLAGFFTTQYYPQNRSSLSNLLQEYNNDYSFKDGLRYERTEQRKTEVRDWLFSNYGYGMAGDRINVGYVKDKKGEYTDLQKAFSLLYGAMAGANRKIDYWNDAFNQQVNEAIAIWETALKEVSADKNARIDQKVAAMIYGNIALAYYELNDFDKAEEWVKKITKAAGNNTEQIAYSLKESIADKRARFAANGFVKGVQPDIADRGYAKPMLTKEDMASPANEPVVVAGSLRDYIVITPGDTMDVRFIIPSQDVMPFGDSLWLEDEIIVMKDNKRVEIYPMQIHSYSYKGIVRESLTWVKDMNVTPWQYEKKFCKRLAAGAIPVYRYYYVAASMHDHTQNVVKSTLYYKKGDRLQEVMFLNFNKGVSKIIADYPELAERVKNGAYQREDFVKMMREYNEWIKNKQKG
jgi:tetratricopeptide (TPR) repeat protein